MLPWKIMKVEPLRLAKSAFPPYSEDNFANKCMLSRITFFVKYTKKLKRSLCFFILKCGGWELKCPLPLGCYGYWEDVRYVSVTPSETSTPSLPEWSVRSTD